MSTLIDPKVWFKDAAERVIFTFIETFAGAIAIAPAINLSTLHAAAIAGAASAAAYVKTTAATQLPGAMSPASLVTPPAPPMGTTLVNDGSGTALPPITVPGVGASFTITIAPATPGATQSVASGDGS